MGILTAIFPVMYPGRLFLLISVLIGSACRALYIPHDIHSYSILTDPFDIGFEENYHRPRRIPVKIGYRPDKREFNADDLTLRFGKRSGDMAFHPNDLALRFGR
ncbi:hypothetical protein NECAME_01178 [Necator americanus]|uniref:Uncharacterized protein n=1 Tax=Necator americanus TaxID=51031 RepID=W2SHM9_NECAM|nr:hypothetical protein NECAME_01178 [Necator americanus]ETN69068.1 hypothetical protein NECAME_01178 [Necator americanus]